MHILQKPDPSVWSSTTAVRFGSHFAFGFVAYLDYPGQQNQAPSGQRWSLRRVIQFPPGGEWVGWLLADTELYQGSGFHIPWERMARVTEPGDGAFVGRLL